MLASAYFLWAGDYDRVFVMAALGSLFFFIGIRFQVKERLAERERRRELADGSGFEAVDTTRDLEREEMLEDNRD